MYNELYRRIVQEYPSSISGGTIISQAIVNSVELRGSSLGTGLLIPK